MFYTQPRVKKVIPNFAKVGEVKEVFVYAWEGTEFIEPPPTSEMPSKYGPTCKFGRFGKTPAVLINATLAKCLTPAITENVRVAVLTSAEQDLQRYVEVPAGAERGRFHAEG